MKRPLEQLAFRSSTLLVGCTLVALGGCTSPVAKRTASFAKASAPAIVETQQAYALVQTVHAGAVMADRVAEYDQTSIRKPVPTDTFGTPEDQKARQDALELLGTYVVLLDEVSGDTPGKAIDTGSKASAAALAKLAGSGLAAAGSKATVSSNDATGIGVALDALARIVMERHRRRALPTILRQADGPVQTICSLLERDFGTSVTGPGLRDVVHTDYEDWLAREDTAIRTHPNGYTFPEKQAAVEALFALEAKEAADDAALVKARAALVDLAHAHHELAATASDKDAPGFRAQLGELVVAAHELAALEKKGDSK